MHTIPAAYFLTFRCYGTWLHGDERGSMDARKNVFDTPLLLPDADLEQRRRSALKHAPVHLDADRRAVVGTAIRETCAFRNWTIHAIAVRTNHVHVVVSVGGVPAETALNALKANATRIMRAHGCWQASHSPWSAGGSTRYLWKPEDIPPAVSYVLEGQGDDLENMP